MNVRLEIAKLNALGGTILFWPEADGVRWVVYTSSWLRDERPGEVARCVEQAERVLDYGELELWQYLASCR